MNELNSRALEIDIREHFYMFSDELVICEQILKKYESAPLTKSELDTLGLLSLKMGNAPSYIRFCLHRFNLDLEISWAHFIACLDQCNVHFDAAANQALLKAILESDSLDEAARCHALDPILPQAQEHRVRRRESYQIEFEQRRSDLLRECSTNQTQGLDEEEERVLEKLRILCPNDPTIEKMHANFLERKWMRILEAKLQNNESPWEKYDFIILDPEEKTQLDVILNSMHLHWAQNNFDEDLGHDFAIALLMWEYPEAALDFLSDLSPTPRIRWTRFEALLRARHFIALLSEIDKAEIQANNENNTEAILALIYLKALGLWGLGNRPAALEMMRTIVHHHPNYRSAMTLLRMWGGGLST